MSSSFCFKKQGGSNSSIRPAVTSAGSGATAVSFARGGGDHSRRRQPHRCVSGGSSRVLSASQPHSHSFSTADVTATTTTSPAAGSAASAREQAERRVWEAACEQWDAETRVAAAAAAAEEPAPLLQPSPHPPPPPPPHRRPPAPSVEADGDGDGDGDDASATVREVRIDAATHGVDALRRRNAAHSLFMQRRYQEAAAGYGSLAQRLLSAAAAAPPAAAAAADAAAVLLVNQAVCLARAGEHAAAAAAARRAAELCPSDAAARVACAHGCLAAGDAGGARRALQDLLHELPVEAARSPRVAELVRAHALLAAHRRHAAGGRPAEAVAALDALPASLARALPVARLRLRSLLRVDAAAAAGGVAALLAAHPGDPGLRCLKARAGFWRAQDGLSLAAAAQLAASLAEGGGCAAEAAELLRQMQRYEVLKAAAAQHVSRRRYAEAREEYGELARLEPACARLVSAATALRAGASLLLRRHAEAAEEYASALEGDPGSPHAYKWHLGLARALQQRAAAAAAAAAAAGTGGGGGGEGDGGEGDLDRAVRECEAAAALNRSRVVLDALEDMQALRAAAQGVRRRREATAAAAAAAAAEDEGRAGWRQRRLPEEGGDGAGDHSLYKVLEASAADSAETIKARYRRQARRWHPDKWASASAGEHRAAEARFKSVAHAYSVLSDPKMRSRYDRGRRWERGS